MQHPFTTDEFFGARLQEAYRSASAPEWATPESPEPLVEQIAPLLGVDTEPDPTFFIDSWTIGVSAASENFLRRHEAPTRNEGPTPAVFPSFSFVTFLNVDPAPPVPPAATGPAKRTFVASARDEAETDAFPPGPLTFQAACRLLGVAATSTRDQVRAAYRQLATRYHPDRLEGEGYGDPKLASDRMAAINEAYRLVCASATSRSA